MALPQWWKWHKSSKPSHLCDSHCAVCQSRKDAHGAGLWVVIVTQRQDGIMELHLVARFIPHEGNCLKIYCFILLTIVKDNNSEKKIIYIINNVTLVTLIVSAQKLDLVKSNPHKKIDPSSISRKSTHLKKNFCFNKFILKRTWVSLIYFNLCMQYKLTTYV